MMGTPHIGQMDNMKMSTVLFLTTLNTFLLSSILAFLIFSR